MSSFSEYVDRLVRFLEPLGVPPFDRIVVTAIDRSNPPGTRFRMVQALATPSFDPAEWLRQMVDAYKKRAG